MQQEQNRTIGFIGTGVMGRSMAKNLLKSGYSMNIFTRTKEKAQELIELGAAWKESIEGVARDSDVVITMVGYPRDVEEVYFGEGGILLHASSGTYVVDMTTSKPALAEEIFEKAKAKGVEALDAPVSGGDVGAKNGKLAIMVGGDQEAYYKLLPVFEVMGDNIILQGGAGAGQHTKLANQITIASNMVGVCEAISYARKAGLDAERVLDSITTGAAGSFSLSKLGPRMLKGDYAPGFYVKHFIKDMTIALEAAEEMGLSTPGLSLSLELYQELAEQGDSDSGTQALIKLFERSNCYS
ncbi:NAD(P)-dependent oxidoreductase [Virgibacillus xinjiangensis]|uniref:NAD(P)-dependent oxidoreductase n=1 Tax=Virgibacillus xinjiangensis TaxID=393090 RepID=A0ABV7CT76_9BACI